MLLEFRTYLESSFDPVQRKKVSYQDRAEILERYQGRKDIFGSFTHVNKLGINPQSEFDTPIGIYGYPIDFILENADETGQWILPYCGDNPYLHI